MNRQEWIKNRAYDLWKQNGCPDGMALTFWLAAERDYDDHTFCVLSPGNCKHQEVTPTTGGKHVSICRNRDGRCRNKVQPA